jgi:hypothetical protein
LIWNGEIITDAAYELLALSNSWFLQEAHGVEHNIKVILPSVEPNFWPFLENPDNLPEVDVTDRFQEYIDLWEDLKYTVKQVISKRLIGSNITSPIFLEYPGVDLPIITLSDTLVSYLLLSKSRWIYDIKRNTYFLESKHRMWENDEFVLPNQTVEIDGVIFKGEDLWNFLVWLNWYRAWIGLLEIGFYGLAVESYKARGFIPEEKFEDELKDQKFYIAWYAYGNIEKNGSFTREELRGKWINLMKEAKIAKDTL